MLAGLRQGRAQHEMCREMAGVVGDEFRQPFDRLRMAALCRQCRRACVQEHRAGGSVAKPALAQFDRILVRAGPVQDGRIILDELYVDPIRSQRTVQQ